MLQLHEFLQRNKNEILSLTEKKTLELAGSRSSSDEMREGLPIFFQQFLGILLLERPPTTKSANDQPAATKAANKSDEQGMAEAAGKPEEAAVAKSAALHGIEMLRLGYSLSHVVHAYGAMCQSITELAARKRFVITAGGFHDLNQCLDVAIAGAVTEYQKIRDGQEMSREVKHLGYLAHEMRNALTSASIAFQLAKRGTVGLGGNTGYVLEKSLKQMQELIDRSLTEVRLRVDPEVHVQSGHLLMIVDQILVTAEVEAREKEQRLDVNIDAGLMIEADQQAFHSALSNLVQNALKFTRRGGRIQLRGKVSGEKIVVEVEDECGGLSDHAASELFKPFTQKNENRKGLGLGLTIAHRAIVLNHGTLEVENHSGKGCIFRITLPKNAVVKTERALPAA